MVNYCKHKAVYQLFLDVIPAPLNVSISSASILSAVVRWTAIEQRTEAYDKVIGYTVAVRNETHIFHVNTSSDMSSVSLNNLLPYVNYSVSVVGRGDETEGIRSEWISFKTNGKFLPATKQKCSFTYFYLNYVTFKIGENILAYLVYPSLWADARLNLLFLFRPCASIQTGKSGFIPSKRLGTLCTGQYFCMFIVRRVIVLHFGVGF